MINLAFFKKEFYETNKTHKSLILILILLVIGLISPAIALIMPDIFKNIDDGIQIIIPDPTMIDAYVQFFKNVNQMGIIVLIILAGGTLANEISRGTIVNVLTRGISHKNIVLSKFLAYSLLWFTALSLGFICNYFYAYILFDKIALNNIFLSVFCTFLLGEFLISNIFVGSSLIKSNFSGIAYTVIIYIFFGIVSVFKSLNYFNPIYLGNINIDLINGSLTFLDIYVTIIMTILFIIINLFLAIKLLKNKTFN